MTGDDLRKHVLVWLVEDHNLRPEHAWRIEVARRLVCDEMQPAWDELVRHGVTDGRHVLSYVIDAAEDAHRECVRLSTSEEAARIAVRREPVAAALTPDGATLFVANLLPRGAADGAYTAAVLLAGGFLLDSRPVLVAGSAALLLALSAFALRLLPVLFPRGGDSPAG